MKLSDLVTEQLNKPIGDIHKSTKVLAKVPQSNKWNQIGVSGLQAKAYQQASKLGKDVVIKVVRITGDSDPSYQFLRLCHNHQTNPHFPKIYSIKEYQNKGGSSVLIITMEKLYRIPDDNKLLYYLFGLMPNDIDLTLSTLLYTFDELELRKEIATKTQHASLRQALRLLEPLFRHYLPDIHQYNIMYRKSPRGPTLVFLDPIQSDV
ncbi:hypothetical protein M0R04_07585 [Candidatus Dojkabacteria bacterium]|jgi:hypothetical protein|nr:hypothetical protein [Candidatus Dojkabacteria bacterium]